MFTAPRRVVRDGVLVAFKGQSMTEERAIELGLLRRQEPELAPEPAPKPKRKYTRRKTRKES